MAGYIGANTSSVTNNQNAAERRKKFTFTTNTTALTGLSFLPNKIHIFHNGIRLVKDTDFLEAADGQSVTLINAAQAGDEVVAVTFEQNPSINTGSAYGDTDVDAHLLTAGVTLDATNDRVGIGASTPQQLLEVNKASADTRVRVHSSTNSTPSAGIELMRGTNTTFGADAYTDFRIENINGGHLAFSTGESGTTTERMRMLAGGGLTFNGDTAADNALDDYEQGTFTATLGGYYSNPSSAVTTTAYYTKIGNTVQLSIAFENVNTTGASGDMWITGLPFVHSGPYTIHSCSMNFAGTYPNSSPFGLISGNICYLYKYVSNGAPTAVFHNAGTGRVVRLTGNYRVA
jgi:hypothetical protein